jgi:aminomethyltransferase
MTVAAERERPRLILPGLAPIEPGVERYWVKGGGATVIPLEGGDQLSVIDLEGRQPAELTFLLPSGGDGAAAMNVRPDAPATGLAALVRDGGEDAHRVLGALAARGLDPNGARALRLFGPDSPAGASVTLTATAEVLCVIAAPGWVMRIDDPEPNPPSDLRVVVRRARPRRKPEAELPPPLAAPLLDFQVDRATARSYEVKAGEYIQVIDVRGRQCSDFLAFDRRRLDDGVERGLDAVTTRTLMGSAYPGPGLYSKFYDQDMQPLVEVVRDTVGRHDTFMLACTSKYYEDMGYFGHANCSDNFSRELGPYGIQGRKGWPAINFFYNTRVDEQNTIYLDEPWSRPGDYVLLTDLVCASSACPDDIDAANGWDPTEIHVRTYPAKRTFSKAVAHRVTPDAEPKLTRETAFHPRTAALTRRFTEYRGYWLPTSFTGYGAIEEYWACRERAVVMDLSPLRKFEVTGPDAEALLQATMTRNVRRLAVGQVVYTAMCNHTGGMLDDGTIFRLGENLFRFVGADDYDGVWLREQAQRLGLERVWVKSSTDQLHNLSVQGPASRELLTPLIWTPPAQPAFEELTWFRFTIGRLGDHNGIPLLVSRTGYSGELGYELWCHPRDALALWDAVWDAGKPYGMLPLGLDALDMLRIEAGLIFSGYEFDETIDPFEAGIGFTVPASKEDDFVGKAALDERRAHPQRVLVGLELEGNEPAAHGDCVHAGRPQVGVVTSATRSPLLRKNIALARMAIGFHQPGTQVEVAKLDGYQKRIPATVVPFPFYDPKKERPRS